MREGTWLRRRADVLTLDDLPSGTRLLRRGVPPREIPTGADLSDLLDVATTFDSVT